MIANGSREKLLRAHESVTNSWEDLCKAETALLVAQQEQKAAREAYEARLKGWELMVRLCTPGDKTKDGS